jgi:hypothetical protein
VTTAHPVSGHPHVDIPLLLTAGGAALLVFVVALAVPARSAAPMGPVSAPGSWSGALSRPQLVVRVVAVVLLVLTIAAGRFGTDDELENLAPALVVGAGWPLLVLGSAVAGPVWRWTDPWDGVARALGRQEPDQPSPHVWPAVAVALAVVWYLSAYPDPLDPRAVGTAVALYTILTLAGCVARGRVRWLSSAEPLGLLLSWLALLPRGRLADWEPPHGAEALLGVLAGGVLFGSVRQSELWGGLLVRPAALLLSTLGLLVVCVLVAGVLLAMARLGQASGGRVGVARAVVPAVAGIVLAVALERDRLFVSVQLLPGLLGDPFGLGWDLLGSPIDRLDPAPLSAAALLTLQLGIVVLGHLAGGLVVGRRLRDSARLPAATVLLHLVAGSLVVVAAH